MQGPDRSLPWPFNNVVFAVNDFEGREESSFPLGKRAGSLTAGCRT